MIRPVSVALLLGSLLASVPQEQHAGVGQPPRQQRHLEPLPFQLLKDSPASRVRYPHLVEALTEARAFNGEFPDAVPFEIHVAEVAGRRLGMAMDVVIAQFRGTMNCGTLGCATWVVGIAAAPQRTAESTTGAGEPGGPGAAIPLLHAYTHPSSPPQLSRCGENVTFLMVTGHGMELAWTEWHVQDEMLLERVLEEEDAPAETVPPCLP